MPRLKDLKDQPLYKLDRAAVCGDLDSLFRASVDTDLIRGQWDQLVRLTASLRNRPTKGGATIEILTAISTGVEVHSPPCGCENRHAYRRTLSLRTKKRPSNNIGTPSPLRSRSSPQLRTACMWRCGSLVLPELPTRPTGCPVETTTFSRRGTRRRPSYRSSSTPRASPVAPRASAPS